VRVGIHAAEATDMGGDYAGKGVHAAARIAAAAAGGEILVSRATLDSAGETYPPDALRSLEVRGLAEPLAVVALAWQA
jgi:class 3 adenylate cyclase